ncbi:fatty acid hydroxylase [Crassisporium funariophilum]|nr:fatty acid hydroxylase [Crassisporium funariophilum]
MDLVLRLCDEYFLDKVWASLVPLSAFGASPDWAKSLNATAKFIPVVSSSSSTWSRLVSQLPHPPLSQQDIASLYTANSHSIAQVSAWPREYIPRQILSLSVLTLIGIHVLYFLFAWLSYTFIFNHDMMRHPRFLKNQVRLEIQCSLRAFPGMTLLTLPWFQAEVMGYTKMYDGVDTYGYLYLFASVPLFLLFTDYGIYWVHRWLHIPALYKIIHKPHHKWIIPTPFASHAFHPLDGYLQSVPYHLFIFIFPVHRILYLVLFVAVNIWSILIHDSDMITGHPLEHVINGPAHHTLHHLYFTVNYGQYFTWADRAGGSYRHPESHLDPLLEVQALKSE